MSKTKRAFILIPRSRCRRRRPRKLARASQPAEQTPAAFEEALAAGILLPRDPSSASRLLEQLRGRVDAAHFDDMRERLLVALEDRGQETILRYLEGDQIPQSKADFLACEAYFTAALHLAPDSSFDE